MTKKKLSKIHVFRKKLKNVNYIKLKNTICSKKAIRLSNKPRDLRDFLEHKTGNKTGTDGTINLNKIKMTNMEKIKKMRRKTKK